MTARTDLVVVPAILFFDDVIRAQHQYTCTS